jgi:ParB family chromosome partitioning protein
MARKALGKGISALLGGAKPELETSLRELEVALLEPNPFQTREVFDKERLRELARSLEVNGFVQPIAVRQVGDRFQIIAGERRWRAAQLLGLRKIPAVVRPLDDDQLMQAALIENLQRENLNPMEEARAYSRLANEFGLTQEEVARRTGKERSTVTNFLRLLKLTAPVQELVKDGKLSMGHARALLALDDPHVQQQLAAEASTRGWSVRRVERLTSQQRKSSRKTGEGKGLDPNVKAASAKLETSLGTRVRIVPNGNRGRIEIEYYSQEELQRLYQLLLKN